MSWWWLSSSRELHANAASEAHMQDAQSAIASLFEPGNRTLTTSSLASTSATSTAGQPDGSACPTTVSTARDDTPHRGTSNVSILMESTSGGWRRWSKRVNACLPFWPSPSSPSTPSGNVDEAQKCSPRSPVSTKLASGTTSPPISWDQLPPSPLAGYKLTKCGLVDTLRTPPHTLTHAELQDVIRELTTVEQNAKYDVDKQFAGHLGSRGMHGLELVVNPCLFLTGIYLMTWKTVRLYKVALPQDSLVFTRLLSLLHWRMSASQREQLAQRHRRLMRATNARVALSFWTGVGVSSVAWVSRPSRNVMEDAPDMQAAKETVAYQRHAEASLKWCWYVYYHHPAYRRSGHV